MMETIPFLLFLAIVFFVVFFIRVSRETIAKHTDWTSQDVPPRSEDTVEKPPLSKKVVQGSAYVVDGDTITIRKTQVRLFGIDAPELDHPFGRNAKSALITLCKGDTVRAEIIAQDSHGRAVARCYLKDGRDLSAEMVKLGLAIDWPKFSDGKYRSLEVPGARRKLWLADARQKGRMHVWDQYNAQKNTRNDPR